MLFFIKIIGVITVLIIILTIIASFFKIKNITVEPGEHYTEEEIINLVIKDRTDNISYILYLKDKLLEQNAIPFVQKIDIKIIDKNSVYLQVYDKKITGCVYFMGSYMYFDLDGIVVESSNEHLEEIPIISGLVFDKIVLNEALKVQKNNMFNIILNISNTIQKYNLKVERVEFLKNEEVVLYCDGHVIELGRHEFYDEHISLICQIVKNLGDEKYKIYMKDITNGQDKYLAEPLK